jgi:beta-lactamase superfamily II metal-dependent hydrolase
LKATEIAVLEAVVVSHLDVDHIGGMHEFLQRYTEKGGAIRRLFIDKDRPKMSNVASDFADLAMELHENKKLVLRSATRRSMDLPPEVVVEGSDWCIDILSPAHATRFKHDVRGTNAPNVLSAVVRVRYANQSVIIGGDAPLGAWEQLEPEIVNTHTRAFRVPHHGGDISEGRSQWTVDQFYQKLAPDIAIFSVGTNNGYEHPRLEHMQAAKAGRACRRLCTQITARCHSEPLAKRDTPRYTVGSVLYPYRQQTRRGNAESPCTGSIMLTIDPSGGIRVVPAENDWHDTFVKSLDNPLCLR